MDGVEAKQTLLEKEKPLRRFPGEATTGKQPVEGDGASEPYLTSVHVTQGTSRLFVVIRFKATDVSLSEVGCAPHLKKNS